MDKGSDHKKKRVVNMGLLDLLVYWCLCSDVLLFLSEHTS